MSGGILWSEQVEEELYEGEFLEGHEDVEEVKEQVEEESDEGHEETKCR